MPESDEIAAALQRAITLHREGDLTNAEPAYRQVLKLDPRNADALHLLGVLAHQLGNSPLAIERIRQSLEIEPEQMRAYFNLGRVYAESGQPDEAIACYERVVAMKPDYAEAHQSLGHLHSEAERYEQALECYRRAEQLQPESTQARMYVAQTLDDMSDWEAAVGQYRTVLERDRQAVGAYRRLGAALRKLGRLEEAAEVYEQWLNVDAQNPEALHFRAACRGEVAPQRASDGFVRATFDGFAPDFDKCLEDLHYRVPEIVARILARIMPEPDRQLEILDLGCGTGLCGAKLRPYARYLAGLDLSPNMLDVARGKELYDKLYEGELTRFLADRENEFDMLVSADTFVYFGDLAEVMRQALRALRPGGALIFTVERWADEDQPPGYRLNEFGRYMHSELYLRRILHDAGFHVHALGEELLRIEGGHGVIGLVVVAAKPAG